MEINEIRVFENTIFEDGRGYFQEMYKESRFRSASIDNFNPKQSNLSVSNYGVIRGIHYSIAKSGQAKMVSCVHGSILDVAIDLRIGSPNFLKVFTIKLKSTEGKSVFIPHGFGHGFQSLEDKSMVTYLLDTEYEPTLEKEIYVFDSQLKIPWYEIPPILSAKDANANSLRNARSENQLPIYMSQ